MKKNNFMLFVFALSIASFTSPCNEQNNVLAIAYISNNILFLEQYTEAELLSFDGKLDQDIRKIHNLAAINLEHHDCIIEIAMFMNQMALAITADKSQTIYLINLNALSTEIFMPKGYEDFVIFSPWQHHEICNEEPPLLETEAPDSCFKLTFTKSDKRERMITFDCPITSICGVVVPIDHNTSSPAMISFDEAASKDLLVPLFVINEFQVQKNDYDFAEEDSMDDILNAMEKDGTFEVKPVGPVMAFLRNVGGHMLIGYLACKEYLERISSRLFHREQTPCPMNNQSTM